MENIAVMNPDAMKTFTTPGMGAVIERWFMSSALAGCIAGVSFAGSRIIPHTQSNYFICRNRLKKIPL